MKVIKYNDGNDNKYMTEDQKKKNNICKYEKIGRASCRERV